MRLIMKVFGSTKVTVTSVLKDGSGVAITNGTVSLSYQKVGQAWIAAGSSVTNITGTATISVFLKRGTYNFRTTFNGSVNYSPATAEKDGVQV